MFFMGIIAALEQPVVYEQLSEEALLLLTAKGDKEAFHGLYQKTDQTIYSFILSMVKNPTDAEELMQETYLKVWVSAGAYQPQGKPLAWMFTIARNLCYMQFRERKQEAELGLHELTEQEVGECCPQIEDAADKLVLSTALANLNEEERQIVLLKTAGGMKHREIAAALGLPLATVLSKYHRSVKKLQKLLREEGEA